MGLVMSNFPFDTEGLSASSTVEWEEFQCFLMESPRFSDVLHMVLRTVPSGC